MVWVPFPLCRLNIHSRHGFPATSTTADATRLKPIAAPLNIKEEEKEEQPVRKRTRRCETMRQTARAGQQTEAWTRQWSARDRYTN